MTATHMDARDVLEQVAGQLRLNQADQMYGGREMALAVTKIQEAIHWLDEAEAEILGKTPPASGDTTPYGRRGEM